MINVKIAKAKKCYDVESAFSVYITFDYDQRIVDTVKSLPQRFYNADKKEWEAPLPALKTVVDNLPMFDFDITGPYINMTEEKPVAEIPVNFNFKTKPFKHQIEGFEYGLANNRWLLGDEQGLGKTKQVIDIAVAKKLQKCYKHCLIICGVNGLKWNWVNEVHTHSDEDAWILGQRFKGRKISIGSTNDKLYDLKHVDSISPYFLITNVETMRNEDCVKEIQKLCKDGTIGIVAIDEVHKCLKNPNSQQGKGTLKIQPECRIAMSGTPLMNTPFDLYGILKWLGYEGHSFSAFKNHYAMYGGFGGYEVVGYRYLDELQKQLDKIMLRRLKKDVLDLPEKTHIDEYVEMTPKQAQIYREVTADIKMNIDQIKMANNPLAELIRMRQATGYTGILSSTIKESAKLDRMEELVDEAVENGKKVVIFSNWTQMTLPIYNRLAVKYHGTYITGEVDSGQRAEHVRRFQEDDDCKFVVGTVGAMGTGLTLTSGTVEIFMDEPWNRANKEQAEDRCHRVGTTENITIYTILCKNTIDERIHELVERKGQMADALVDGKINIDKGAMLDFLLS